ncbi:MAG: single-stranded-DNA-specific exonuclease RecJ [Candidatus Moranbacteria bacterium]|nr:single-stranded-DNA-specific exonuclease RecJ [Candidatus Moranbacteria bacterium]
MEKRWALKKKAKKMGGCFSGLENITEQILLNRGFKNEKELETFFVPNYDKDLHDPFLLNDMNKAIERVLGAQKNKEKICIYGDYDADGVTSSALMTSFLTEELKMNPFSYIPDREEEGYGLNKKSIDYVEKQGATLIITVDCGVTNVKEIDYANDKNIDVIVLDHHNVLDEIPKALAIIDPKNPAEKKYPFRELAGVGVAFKFLQGLTTKSQEVNEEKLKWYLDLVAIGTVADCVPLLDENRTLVKFGLMVLAKTKRVGLRQLFQIGRMKIGEGDLPTAQQIAFQVAPRINAAGRMKHASIAYELLTEKSEIKANKLAQEMELQNKKRQKITADVIKGVKKEIEALKKIPKIIIRTSSEWKIGIVGLSAGRLVEEYDRPVILLQEKNGFYRGSGRSIPGFNLVEALQKQKKFLVKYGGHDQAAGLTVSKENFPKFEKAILKEAQNKFPKNNFKVILVEAELKIDEISKKLCEEISMLEPFGKGNELPILLLKKGKVVDKRLLGNGEKHLKLWIGNKDCSETFEAIGFSLGENSEQIKIGGEVDLLFNLEKNNWNGNDGMQLKIIDYKKS